MTLSHRVLRIFHGVASCDSYSADSQTSGSSSGNRIEGGITPTTTWGMRSSSSVRPMIAGAEPN